jgi:hypothetical protein
MHSLFYRSQGQAFAPLFNDAAASFVPQLSFSTKEEYLQWVSQWKAYYRNLSRYQRRNKLLSRCSGYCGAEKAERLTAEANKFIPTLETDTLYRSTHSLLVSYGIPTHNLATQLTALLVLRKASKLRAAAQRQAGLTGPVST